MVLLESQKENFKYILSILKNKKIRGLLIKGPRGSGKTFFIDCLEKIFDQKTFVRVYLDEEIDNKMLIGLYNCTKVPGNFEFVPGALSIAAKFGHWVVFENAQNSSFEFVSALISFIKEKTFLLNGSDTKIHTDFRIFMTYTTTNAKPDLNSKISVLLNNLFHSFETKPFGISEKQEIVSKKYFNVVRLNILPLLFSSFDVVDRETEFTKCDFSVSLVDFVKCCKRVDAVLEGYNGAIVVSKVKEKILKEIENTLIAGIPTQTTRKSIFIKIGKLLNFSELKIDRIFGDIDPIYADLIQNMAKTNHSLNLLQKIVKCVDFNEPVLLVGETGVGKTSIIQNFAFSRKKKLIVYNVHHQTEPSDIFGGYRPLNIKTKFLKLMNIFKNFISLTASKNVDVSAFDNLNKAFSKENFKKSIKIMIEKMGQLDQIITVNRPDLYQEWRNLTEKILKFEREIVSNIEKRCIFKFEKGVLYKAIKNGDWVLLDELNLASPPLLDRIASVLTETRSENAILNVLEKGEPQSLKANPDFRLFASFNPPTDFGKKSLPPGILEKFTLIHVDDILDETDIQSIIKFHLDRAETKSKIIDQLAKSLTGFYLKAKSLSADVLLHSVGFRPDFSIRTLVRGLRVATESDQIYPFKRALFEGLSAVFLSPLDGQGEAVLKDALRRAVFSDAFANSNEGNVDRVIGKALAAKKLMLREGEENKEMFCREGLVLKKGGLFANEEFESKLNEFILTDDVKAKLKKILRIISVSPNAVLLEGPTSSGKTSLIKYLSYLTGNRFFRINNHEHTDIQEYTGSYESTPDGSIKFAEGVLVEAVRNGHWIILDELNLAPTEVLEALNRLLDDNRELFLPETGEAIKAHPNFRIFATQNPVGLYLSRRPLSKAFKNRFIEIFVGDIPPDQLGTIIHLRCGVLRSHSSAMVAVMEEIQRRGRAANVFSTRRSVVTSRDLIKWAKRGADGFQELAENGYSLFAEKLEKEDDKSQIKEILERFCPGAKLTANSLDYNGKTDHLALANLAENAKSLNIGIKSITWNSKMTRLFHLVRNSLLNNEPVLLIGGPGSCKTTICQLFSVMKSTKLHIFNCNQNTEASDFIGEQRPVRNKAEILKNLRTKISLFLESFPKQKNCAYSVETLITDKNLFSTIFDAENEDDPKECALMKNEIKELHGQSQVLFEWNDGVLLKSMKNGEIILFDEISLAENAVIERLNSVLEDSRTIFVPGLKGAKEIHAKPGFNLIATMNPPGDYGKKDLSKAFKNRFTEIYCPSLLSDFTAIENILKNRLIDSDCPENAHLISKVIAEVTIRAMENNQNRFFTLRDIIAWCDFIKTPNLRDLPLFNRMEEGLKLIHNGNESNSSNTLRSVFLNAAGLNLNDKSLEADIPSLNFSSSYQNFRFETHLQSRPDSSHIGIPPFFIQKGLETPMSLKEADFYINSEVCFKNAVDLLRAMQLNKAVLLEGSPGVGKTSLVVALAKLTGNRLTRLNLSEHTDVMDLFGSDLPCANGDLFGWSDGALIKALKNGEWVLLDELNLAPQTVLEGLNSLLDHRREIYIPEIDKTFSCPETFRIFGSQNPAREGGGRKGLPESFLNRLVKVYLNPLKSSDLTTIVTQKFPDLDQSLIERLVAFNKNLNDEILTQKSFGLNGAPWEFNLRDLFKVCHLLKNNTESVFYNGASFAKNVDEAVESIYILKFRTLGDRESAVGCFESAFGRPFKAKRNAEEFVASRIAGWGDEFVRRKGNGIRHKNKNCFESFPRGLGKQMEALIKCVQNGWPSIITGNDGSFKTSAVKALASVTGEELKIIHLTPEFDSSELLGSYEQFDVKRHKENASTLFETSSRELKQILQNFSESEINFINEADSDSARKMIGLENEILEKTKNFNQNDKKRLNSLFEIFKKIDCTNDSKSIFEWVDSPIVKAIENGHWVLIENINFCAPAVLDRLNSLLEHNGELIINESGCLADGSLRKICPHRDFRIFFTLNPVFGQVSRSMRNRCVEIHLDDLSPKNGPKLFSADLKSLISAIIPNSRLVDLMIDFSLSLRQFSAKKIKDWAESASAQSGSESFIAVETLFLSAKIIFGLDSGEIEKFQSKFGDFLEFERQNEIFKTKSDLRKTNFQKIFGDICQTLSKNCNLDNVSTFSDMQNRVLSMIAIENMNFKDFDLLKKFFENNCDLSLSPEEQLVRTFVSSEYLGNFGKFIRNDFKGVLDVENFNELPLNYNCPLERIQHKKSVLLVLSRHLFAFPSVDYPENNFRPLISNPLTPLIFKFIASSSARFSLKSYFKLCFRLSSSFAQLDIISRTDTSKLFFWTRKALKYISKMYSKRNTDILAELFQMNPFEKAVLMISIPIIKPSEITQILSVVKNKQILRLQYCSVGYEMFQKEIDFSENAFPTPKNAEIEKIWPKEFNLSSLNKEFKEEINPILYISSKLKKMIFDFSTKGKSDLNDILSDFESEKACFLAKIDFSNKNDDDLDEVDEESIDFENNLVEEANSNLNSMLVISIVQLMEIINPIAKLFEDLIWCFSAENAIFISETSRKNLKMPNIRRNLEIAAEFGFEHTNCGSDFLIALINLQNALSRSKGEYFDFSEIDRSSFVKTINDFLIEKRLIDRAIEKYCVDTKTPFSALTLSNAIDLKNKLKITPINSFVNSLLIFKLCDCQSFFYRHQIAQIPTAIAPETSLNLVQNSLNSLKERILKPDLSPFDPNANDLRPIIAKIDEHTKKSKTSAQTELPSLKIQIFALKLLTLLQIPKHDPKEKYETDHELTQSALDSLKNEINTRESIIDSRSVRKVNEAINELRTVQTFFREKADKIDKKRNFRKNRKSAFDKIKAVSAQFYPKFSKCLSSMLENNEFLEKSPEMGEIAHDLCESMLKLLSETTFFDCNDFCKPMLFCALAIVNEVKTVNNNKCSVVGHIAESEGLNCFGDHFIGNVCRDILAEFDQENICTYRNVDPHVNLLNNLLEKENIDKNALSRNFRQICLIWQKNRQNTAKNESNPQKGKKAFLEINELALTASAKNLALSFCRRHSRRNIGASADLANNFNDDVLGHFAQILKEFGDKSCIYPNSSDFGRFLSKACFSLIFSQFGAANQNESKCSFSLNSVDSFEAEELVSAIKSLLPRLKDLQKAFPENSILAFLSKCCYKIMSLSTADTELIEYCLLGEFLLKKSQDWEVTASKTYTLEASTEAILKVLSTWRKSDLLLLESSLTSEKVVFGCYKSLFLISPLVNSVFSNKARAIENLEQFLLQANVGEFQTRLDILKFSACFLCDEKMTKRILMNLYKIYFQYERLVDSHVKTEKTKLEKEIKVIIRMKSWDDKNYWRFVETVDRAKKSIEKILKKWGDILKEPVMTLISSEKEKTQNTFQLISLPQLDLDCEPAKGEKTNVRLREKRKLEFENKPKNKNGFFDTTDIVLVKSQQIEKMTLQIVKKSNSLQKDSCQSEKKMSLAILLKRLAEIFMAKTSTEPTQKFEVGEYIEKIQTLPNTTFIINESITTAFKSTEACFYKNLDKLSALFSLIETGANKDIDLKHKNLMTKIALKIFSNLCSQQNAIIPIIKFHRKMAALSKIALPKNLEKREKTFPVQLESTIEALKNLNFYITPLIGLYKRMAQIHSSFSRENESVLYEKAYTELKIINGTVAQAEAALFEAANSNFELSFGLYGKAVVVNERVTQLKSSLRRINADYVLKQDNFLTEMAENFSTLFLRDSAIIPFDSFHSENGGNLQNEKTDFENETKGLFAHIFRLKVDFETQWSANESVKRGDFDFFCRYLLDLSAVLDDKSDFSRKMADFANILRENAVGLSFEDFEPALLNIAKILDFIEKNLLSALTMHRELNKFEYIVLAHFTKLILTGYGKKADEEEGADEAGKRTEMTEDCEGTGMGEGEGKKDVSEKLENEEQMLGLKGDEEKDQSDKDKGDGISEDFGAEVDADFNGDLFTESEQTVSDSHSDIENALIDEKPDQTRTAASKEIQSESDGLGENENSDLAENAVEESERRGENHSAEESTEYRNAESLSSGDDDDDGQKTFSDANENEETGSSSEHSFEPDRSDENGQISAESDGDRVGSDAADDESAESDGINAENENEAESETFGQNGGRRAENADDSGDGAAGGAGESEGDDEAFAEESDRKRQKTDNGPGLFSAAAEADGRFGRRDESESENKAAALFGAKRRREPGCDDERQKNAESDKNAKIPKPPSEPSPALDRDLQSPDRVPVDNADCADDRPPAPPGARGRKNSADRSPGADEETPKAGAVSENAARRLGEGQSYFNERAAEPAGSAQNSASAPQKTENAQPIAENSERAPAEDRLWAQLSLATAETTAALAQALGRILAPNVASRLAGDYRSGKRLNLRRIVPYVASAFRRDKIWLRRVRRGRRAHQVLLAIDNSESMRDRGVTGVALQALVAVANALSRAEVGEIAIAKMGSRTEIIHGFSSSFFGPDGPKCLASFDFSEKSTGWIDFLSTASAFLQKARAESLRVANRDALQLVLVVTDGAVQESRSRVAALARTALDAGQLFVAVLLDSALEDQVLVEFSGDRVLQKPYLADYPLPHYMALRRVEHLPEVLAEALKQWFEMAK